MWTLGKSPKRPHDKFSGLVVGLSGCRRLPRPSCLVKYNNILLPTNAVKFHIIIVHFCLLCRPYDGSASSSPTSLDSWINAWVFVSDLYACVGFRGSKKVEKHWCVLWWCVRHSGYPCDVDIVPAKMYWNIVESNWRQPETWADGTSRWQIWLWEYGQGLCLGYCFFLHISQCF